MVAHPEDGDKQPASPTLLLVGQDEEGIGQLFPVDETEHGIRLVSGAHSDVATDAATDEARLRALEDLSLMKLPANDRARVWLGADRGRDAERH